MRLAQILSIYINLNILIAFGFITFFLSKWIFLLDKNGYMSVPILANAPTIQGTPIIIAYLFILFSMVLLGGVKFFKDMFHLSRLKRQSYRIRKFGRVSIFVHDTLTIPFSYWFYGQSYFIVPSHFITRREIYKISVLHELQHHRQNDTVWVYALWFLRLFCTINTFMHLWNRWISEIQEFACDETLVNKNKVSFQTYARGKVTELRDDLHSTTVFATNIK